MSIVYSEATREDINELIRMRIEYMIDDFGSVTDEERKGMEAQLPDYFNRKLGTELIAFVAKEGDRIVSVAYLHIIEMPANSILLNGLYADVLSVYTEPAYRGQGICTQLMKNLVEYGKRRGLGRIDLSATDAGYPIYAKVGFKDKEHRYRDMRYKF
ncbi:Acetyltransferase (GNAT) domain-containing protein [Lachnospiraceae bacterium YSD2013]|nr:GNAT family N-acetyltransferase [Lachnospiraceae bacterium]MBR5761553.1 GNAT family N-acetyltransferase [Lachnospiraceae bacterium]SCX09812.1 Acetyltransferase (GNAT) domain-containing protein [Lachnospiraceae bacterium YSD2013]